VDLVVAWQVVFLFSFSRFFESSCSKEPTRGNDSDLSPKRHRKARDKTAPGNSPTQNMIGEIGE